MSRCWYKQRIREHILEKKLIYLKEAWHMFAALLNFYSVQKNLSLAEAIKCAQQTSWHSWVLCRPV